MAKLRTIEDIVEAAETLYNAVGNDVPVKVARVRSSLIGHALAAARLQGELADRKGAKLAAA